ncbi:MAG: outer membrane beta-barrel protein [Pseudomonadota bacterium]
MKTFTGVLASTLLVAGGASAGQFYAGGSVSYSSIDVTAKEFDISGASPSFNDYTIDANMDGFGFGGVVGWRTSPSEGLGFGVETRLEWASTSTDTFFLNDGVTDTDYLLEYEVGWQAGLRAYGTYDLGPVTLIGGLDYSLLHVTTDVYANGSRTDSESIDDLLTGLGGFVGVERAFTEKLIGRLELSYVDYDAFAVRAKITDYDGAYDDEYDYEQATLRLVFIYGF